MNIFKLTSDQKLWLHVIAIIFNMTLIFMPLYKVHNTWLYGILEKSYKTLLVVIIVYFITYIYLKLTELLRKPLNSFLNYGSNITFIPPILFFIFPFYYFSLILAIILTWSITSNYTWILYYWDIIIKYIGISLFFWIIYFLFAYITKIILKLSNK